METLSPEKLRFLREVAAMLGASGVSLLVGWSIGALYQWGQSCCNCDARKAAAGDAPGIPPTFEWKEDEVRKDGSLGAQ